MLSKAEESEDSVAFSNSNHVWCNYIYSDFGHDTLICPDAQISGETVALFWACQGTSPEANNLIRASVMVVRQIKVNLALGFEPTPPKRLVP